MRDYEEILKNPRLRNIVKVDNGFGADIHIGGWDGSLIFTFDSGWEHCSVAPYIKRITPDWDTMCQLKEMFWRDDEAVIQIHPAKADYINNLPNCLHLWRCYYKEMVLPPSILVGIKKGMTPLDIRRETKEAYEMAGEKYDE